MVWARLTGEEKTVSVPYFPHGLRYSSRQKQDMALGGCVGRWTLSGELEEFSPFIHLGQWLHVGKHASFGLGRYQVESHRSEVGVYSACHLDDEAGHA